MTVLACIIGFSLIGGSLYYPWGAWIGAIFGLVLGVYSGKK